MLRQIRREGHLHSDDTLVVSVHPEIAELLATSDHGFLEDLEKRLQKRSRSGLASASTWSTLRSAARLQVAPAMDVLAAGALAKRGKSEGRSEPKHEGRGRDEKGGRDESRGRDESWT